MTYLTQWIHAFLLCLCFCSITSLEERDALQTLKQKIADFKSNLHRTLEASRIRKKRQIFSTTAESNVFSEEHLRVGSSAPEDLPYLSNANLTFWVTVRHQNRNQVLIGTREGHLALYLIDDSDDKVANLIAVSMREEIGLKAKAFSYNGEQWFAILQSKEDRNWIRTYQRVGRGLEGRQVILLEGQSDFDLVTVRGDHYLAVATYRVRLDAGFTNQANVILFHWTKTQFDEVARRSTVGASSVKCWELDGSLYLAVAQESDEKGYLHVGSPVYVYNSRNENRLVLLEMLHTVGPRRVMHFAVSGSHYVIFIGHSDAVIYWWSSNQFLNWQTIKETAGASDISVLALKNGEVVIVITRKEEVWFRTLDSSGYYVVSFTMKLSASVTSLQFMFSGLSYYALAMFAPESLATHSIWKLGFTKYFLPQESSLDPLLQCLSNVRDRLHERKSELNLVNSDLRRVWLTTKNQSVTANVIIEGQVTSKNQSTVVNVVVVTHKTEIPQYTTKDIFESVDEAAAATERFRKDFNSVVLKTSNQVIDGSKHFEGSLFIPSLNSGSTDTNVFINGISIARLNQHGLKKIGDQIFWDNVQLNSLSIENADVKTINGLETKDLLLLKTKQNIKGNLQFSSLNSGDVTLSRDGSINSIVLDHLVTINSPQLIKELKSFQFLKSNVINVQGQVNGKDLDEVKLNIVAKDIDKEISGRLKTDLTIYIAGDLRLPGLMNNAVDLSYLDQKSVKMETKEDMKGTFTFNSLTVNGDINLTGYLNSINTSEIVTLTTDQTISGSFHITSPVLFKQDLLSNEIDGIDLDQEAILKNSNVPQFVSGHKTFSGILSADRMDMAEFVTLDGLDPSLFVSDIVRHKDGVVKENETQFYSAIVLGNVTALGGINGHYVYDLPELVWMKSRSQVIEMPLHVRGEFSTEHDLETGTVNRLNLNSDVVHTFGDEFIISEKTFPKNIVSQSFSLTIGKTINGADLSSFKGEEDLNGKVSGIKVLKSLEVNGQIFTKTLNDLDIDNDVMLPKSFQFVQGSKHLQSDKTLVSGKPKATSVSIDAYKNIDFNQYIADSVSIMNHTSRKILNKRFTHLRASEMSSSNTSTVNGVSMPEMFERAVTLNTEQFIRANKTLDASLYFAKLISTHSLNGLDLVNHAFKVVTVDNTEPIRGSKEFTRSIKTNDLFVQERVNGIDIALMAENAFSKSAGNIVAQNFVFLNDLDIEKLVIEKTLDGIALENLFILSKDETIGSSMILSNMRASKDIFIAGLLNGCDLTKLGYRAIYSENKNNQYVISQWNLESLKVIGNLIVKNELNRVSIEDVKQQIITLSGDQILSGNTLLTAGISTLNINVKNIANLVDLSFIMKDAVRHSIAQNIKGYKTFKSDLTASVYTGAGLFLSGLVNNVNIIDLFKNSVWKTGEQKISGEKSIMTIMAINVTVKDYINGVRLPEDIIMTTISEHIPSPIYLMKDVVINSDLVAQGTIDGTSLENLISNLVTISTDQELTSYLEFLKDSVIYGSMSVESINGVILSKVVSISPIYPIGGIKSFYKDLRVYGSMTTDLVNGYDLQQLAYNTLKRNENENLTKWQYFSKSLNLQNSLTVYWMNNISTENLMNLFSSKHDNVNFTLDYYNSLSKFLENGLTRQLEASAHQIASFAYFTLLQEINLGPSRRILTGFQLTHLGKDFSHSMVIWTPITRCVYQEKCCSVDYSYWVRVKKSGMVMIDSDAEIGKYYPIQDLSQSMPENEFAIWTNATSVKPHWCKEFGHNEMTIASFAETGRLNVYMKIQNSATLSDVRTYRDGHLYAVAGFYYDKRSDEYSSAIVFAYNELKREWSEHQILASFGTLSLDITTYSKSNFQNEILLALGTGMSTYPDSFSSVYKWNDTQRAFKLIQYVPSQYVTSTLWVKKDFTQLLLLAGVDSFSSNDAECSFLSGGQINIYSYKTNLKWIQSIPLSGVASMITFSVEGDVFVAAASSHLQSVVIFQWKGYGGFIDIQTIFVQGARHLNKYWIEDDLYLTVASESGPAKIFKAIRRGKHLTLNTKDFQIPQELKDQPPQDQKFISGC